MTSGDITSIATGGPALRGYRFAVHGVLRASRRRRRPGAGHHRAPYRVTTFPAFDFRRFASQENLMVAFRILRATGGPAPGVDGLTYDDFSPGEMYEVLRAIRRAILDGSYRPHPVRRVRIPQVGRRDRELRLKTIADRTVAKALQLTLCPFWRTRLPGIGRGVWEALARIERIMLDRAWFILATDDIRDAFPSARLADVMADHHQHIGDADLLRLIEAIIRGHDGLAHTIGLEQGCPYSPTAMELRLHNAMDRRLVVVDPDHPLLRYVDNLTHVCSSVPAGRQVLRQDAEILASHGFEIKGEDGDPIDVRDPQSNRKVLGLIPRWYRDHLRFRLPESAWENLRVALQRAQLHQQPVTTARMAVCGWLSALGPVYVDATTHSIVSRILHEAAQQEFREIGNPRELLQVCMDARQRWLNLRREITATC